MTQPTKFISYKSEQRHIAIKVRDTLQSWGYVTWYDQDDIPKGCYFRDCIQTGLENSDVVIGIVTEKALKSREVLTEWDFAYSGKSRLLLLRYEDVELPYWLAGVQYIDCAKDEMLAFDQLYAALNTSDTSSYIDDLTPDYLKRHHPSHLDRIYHPPDHPDDNRAKMLLNVYQTWIIGALYPNLPTGVIELQLGLKPEAVLHHTDFGEYVLPESVQDIGQIFNDMKGELVILGDPGGGKTILLLQLAEKLLGYAQHDPTQPIPAVFNLSSWTTEYKTFADWLIYELKRGYGVPKKIAQDWVENGKLTLLLDGLDEIAPTANIMLGSENNLLENTAIQLRSACIEAINAYRAVHHNADVVVCSRIKDYAVLQTKLNLNAGIVLHPLTDEQISAYLAGTEYAGTRELLSNEATAYEIAQTPFLLTMLKVVCHIRGVHFSN